MTFSQLYLDYVNNFLTVERFAEYHDFSIMQATRVIEKGKTAHESNVEEYQAERKRLLKESERQQARAEFYN